MKQASVCGALCLFVKYAAQISSVIAEHGLTSKMSLEFRTIGEKNTASGKIYSASLVERQQKCVWENQVFICGPQSEGQPGSFCPSFCFAALFIKLVRLKVKNGERDERCGSFLQDVMFYSLFFIDGFCFIHRKRDMIELSAKCLT